MIIEIVCK